MPPTCGPTYTARAPRPRGPGHAPDPPVRSRVAVLSQRLESATPRRDRAVGTRGARAAEDRARVRVPSRGDLPDAHGLTDPGRRTCALHRDRLPFRRDPRLQGATRRAPGAERDRPGRPVHRGIAGRGVRPAPVRARSRALLSRSTRWSRCSRRSADLDGWITAFRRDSSPTRATSPIVDRYELEPGRWIVKINPVVELDPERHVGLPRGARPAAQPAVRPRICVDRLRPLHARSA